MLTVKVWAVVTFGGNEEAEMGLGHMETSEWEKLYFLTCMSGGYKSILLYFICLKVAFCC